MRINLFLLCVLLLQTQLLSQPISGYVKNNAQQGLSNKLVEVYISLADFGSFPIHNLRAVAEAGADAISLINTLRARAIDTKTRKPLLGNISGGLSGPAIKPAALYMIYQAAHAVAVPVIGCGGIVTAKDALEFIIAGASAVEVGTANFTNPCTPLDIIDDIERFMKKEGIRRISDLIGAAT